VPQAADRAWANPAQHRHTRGDAVLAWNEIAADAMLPIGIDPMHESRVYAMEQIAVHDALNAIRRRSQPYAFDGRARGASPEAAVAAAARDVLVPVLQQLPPELAAGVPAAVAEIEAAYDTALAAIPNGPSKQRGVAVGHQSAVAINTLRVGDGSDAPFLDFTEIKNPQPGDFQWVEGAPFEVIPKWAEVKPFVMTSPAELRPPPPYDLTSASYAHDFNELKDLGSITSTTRSKQQTEIAFFWFENSPSKWNQIARTVSTQKRLGMWENARLFALLGVAEADGYIGNWESKQFYNRWRPETAVRLADIDGNPLTNADPTWTPLWGSSGATPEYDSGHTIEGAAAATVLASVFGTDKVTFEACSTSFVPSPATKFTTQNNCDGTRPIFRKYRSFSQAAAENGVSRIYVGWHFRNAVEMGYAHGSDLGNLTLNRFFQPTH
ncbi:MAG: vanadium-dependent haloperoxidase, partial [Ilumatobacteraceae bacterium]